jgi:D-glycero-D-manno-heptose 1,7-bisphosphate phosphatase
MGINPLNRAVFLDRDGVIKQAQVRNGHPFSPADMTEFFWVEPIKEVTLELKSLGYFLFCVTNQPDVGRGLQSREIVESFHATILAELPIEKVFACYHNDRDKCSCRKPRPGMIVEAQKEYDLNLAASWLIGDRWKDIDAGAAAGCNTVFLEYGYDEKLKTEPDYTISQLAQLVPLIRAETLGNLGD